MGRSRRRHAARARGARDRSAAAPAPRSSPSARFRHAPPAALVHVLKVCNGYSNNVLHFASDAIGGPHVVETIARSVVPEALRGRSRSTTALAAAARTGSSTRGHRHPARSSTRGSRRSTARSRTLPVSGVDPGTLKERLLDHRRFVVGKTGTFGSQGASALVGLLRSRRYGTVAFAVLDHGVACPTPANAMTRSCARSSTPSMRSRGRTRRPFAPGVHAREGRLTITEPSWARGSAASRRRAAVDRDDGAAHERGLVRSEKAHDRGDVLRRPQAPERDLGELPLAPARSAHRLRERPASARSR